MIERLLFGSNNKNEHTSYTDTLSDFAKLSAKKSQLIVKDQIPVYNKTERGKKILITSLFLTFLRRDLFIIDIVSDWVSSISKSIIGLIVSSIQRTFSPLPLMDLYWLSTIFLHWSIPLYTCSAAFCIVKPHRVVARQPAATPVLTAEDVVMMRLETETILPCRWRMCSRGSEERQHGVKLGLFLTEISSWSEADPESAGFPVLVVPVDQCLRSGQQRCDPCKVCQVKKVQNIEILSCHNKMNKTQ